MENGLFLDFIRKGENLKMNHFFSWEKFFENGLWN